MKKENEKQKLDELRPKYNLSKLTSEVRGKYADKYREGTNIVHLDPDVAAIFKSDESVNRALRSLIDIAKEQVGSFQ